MCVGDVCLCVWVGVDVLMSRISDWIDLGLGGRLVLLVVPILVPVLAAGHVLRGVAHLGGVVVDLAQLAAQIPGILAVQAHVELLAVGGMGVLGVGHHLAAIIGLGLILGALEAGLRCS